MKAYQYDERVAAALALALGRRDSKIKVASNLERLWESVVHGRMSSPRIDHALDGLLAQLELSTDPAERATLNAAIVALVQGSRKRGTTISDARHAAPILPPLEVKPMPKGSPFYGMGLKEAAPRQLQIYGKPQTPREIWEVLHSTGFQTAHSDPTGAVHSALRRRAKTHGDVLLVGDGRWGRKEWYTEAQLAEIRKSVGGMGGRDKASHSAATTRGMLVARARGARLGAVKKLTDEQAAELEEMLRAGTLVAKVAKHFNISVPSVYNYLRAKGCTAQSLRAEGKKLRAAATKANETEETRH